MAGRGTDDDSDNDADRAESQCDSPIRLVLSVPLPCGIGTCRKPATEALAEPDPTCPGAWVLLPICPACAASAQAEARRIVLRH